MVFHRPAAIFVGISDSDFAFHSTKETVFGYVFGFSHQNATSIPRAPGRDSGVVDASLQPCPAVRFRLGWMWLLSFSFSFSPQWTQSVVIRYSNTLKPPCEMPKGYPARSAA